MQQGHYKDTIIANISKTANVANFVSYDPNFNQRHSCLSGFELNHIFDSPEQVIEELFKRGQEGSLNIRTFDPLDPKSKPFHKGISNPEEVLKIAKEMTNKGLHIIIHEEILDPINLSGVLVGDIIEFAPKTTPRCVEPKEVAKYGIPASLPRELGIKLLEHVFGFNINLNYPKTTRVEFSVFVKPYGAKQDHVMVWELEEVGSIHTEPLWDWPNRFSKFIGDKTYGLLIAHLLNFNVPFTKVIGKHAHFSFGTKTGSPMVWTRTAPAVLTPGKFPTTRGYSDPFAMMNASDHQKVASILVQDEVPFAYSGAAVALQDTLHIEGVKGKGDDFMQGSQAPQEIPEQIKEQLHQLFEKAKQVIGPVRFEWVYDGTKPWIVQLHKGKTDQNNPDIIVPEPNYKETANTNNPLAVQYQDFHITENNLEQFRVKVEDAKANNYGLNVIGNFGITSHVGDILRKANVPSKRIRKKENF